MGTENAGLLLSALGVTVDELLLGISCQLAEETLLGLLHREEIPPQLEGTAQRMAAGLYLRSAVGAGTLKAENIDLSSPVLTALTMGDTSQQWDSSASASARLQALMDAFCTVPDKLIWAYRTVAK